MDLFGFFTVPRLLPNERKVGRKPCHIVALRTVWVFSWPPSRTTTRHTSLSWSQAAEWATAATSELCSLAEALEFIGLGVRSSGDELSELWFCCCCRRCWLGLCLVCVFVVVDVFCCGGGFWCLCLYCRCCWCWRCHLCCPRPYCCTCGCHFLVQLLSYLQKKFGQYKRIACCIVLCCRG